MSAVSSPGTQLTRYPGTAGAGSGPRCLHPCNYTCVRQRTPAAKIPDHDQVPGTLACSGTPLPYQSTVDSAM